MDNLTFLIAGAIFCAYLVGKTGPRWSLPSRVSRRKAWKPAGPRVANAARAEHAPIPISDAAEQLRSVMAAAFEKRRLMSKDEARVFLQVEKTLKMLNLPWRVMAQVSLGEVIRSADRNAHAAINSKRVDMLIISNGGHPIAAVEYQGSGHYLGTAAARDAVKREALRRAGVGFIEITPNHGPDDIAREVQRLAPALSTAA